MKEIRGCSCLHGRLGTNADFCWRVTGIDVYGAVRGQETQDVISGRERMSSRPFFRRFKTSINGYLTLTNQNRWFRMIKTAEEKWEEFL